MKWKYLLLVALGCMQIAAYSQTIEPDIQDTTQWKPFNRSVELINENGKKGIYLNEKQDIGLYILHGSDFTNGSIELDIKGKNKLQQSFVGFAFHVQSPSTYDAIYFRPFNFKADDPVRHSHMVQYISMPDNDWQKLRTQFPGKYENTIKNAPGPEDWFHAKIVVNGKKVSVFVNNEKQPSLEVEKLNNNTKGGFALWVGTTSGGSFANLKITKSDVVPAASFTTTQSIPYGNNPEAGHYFNEGDAKLYYEIYGKGKPLVLMHGGVYGYIDEFEPFIEKLAQNYQVICIGTRGHGKSEIGHTPFSYNQRAEDVYKLVRSITKDSVTVLGFSDGAFGALKLAALHPELVKKLIAIGAGDYPKDRKTEKYNYTPEGLMKSDSAFFAGRVALMPEPKRWGECLTMLNKMYNEDYVSTETFSVIKCPTLIMNGDRDGDNSLDAVVKCAKAIPNSRLSIIPGCWHVVFFCNFPAVWESIDPFLKGQ